MALFCNDKPAATRGNCNNYAKTECNGASRRSEQGGPGPEDGGAKGKEEEDVPRSGGAKGATRGKMVEEMACKRGFVGKRTEPVVRRHLAAPYIFLSFFLPSSLSPSSTRRHHGSSPSRCSLPSPNVSYTFRFTFALLHRASFLFQKENDFSIHFFHSIILLKKKNFQSLIPRVLLDIMTTRNNYPSQRVDACLPTFIQFVRDTSACTRRIQADGGRMQMGAEV